MKYRKKFISLDKFNAKDQKIIVNNFENKSLNIKNNKIIDDAKNKDQCNIIISNTSNPVYTILNSNNKKNNISKQEKKQKQSLKLKTLAKKKNQKYILKI